MKKLALALLLGGCAAPAPVATPVDVAQVPRASFTPPGSMEFVYEEAPGREATSAPPPETRLPAGVTEKPRHLVVGP